MTDAHNAAEKGQLRHFGSTTSTLNTALANDQRQDHCPSKDATEPDNMESSSSSKIESEMTARTRFLDQELEITGMGAVIVVCFFTSGLIDAVAFNSWNCFVGMQTGNTVFAALGIGGQPVASHRQQYYKSLVAIGAFCLGTLFFNFIHRWPTGIAVQPTSRKRLLFTTSFFIQSLFIVIAAALVQSGRVSNMPYIAGTFSSGSHRQQSGNSTNYLDLAPIAILSFEAAGQVCLSRVLSLIELPTIVLSTLFHDFTADLYNTRDLWKSSTSVKDFVFDKFRRQGKRFLSIMALFCGALVGGEMYKSRIGMAGALWCGAGLKVCLTIAFIIWKQQKSR